MSVQRVTLEVSELDCAEEARQLREGLSNRPGIESVDFNVIQGRMFVALDSTTTDVAAVVDAVAKLGMHARVVDRATSAGAARHGDLRRLLLTVASGVLTTMAFALHWSEAGGVVAALSSEVAAPAMARVCYGLAIAAGLLLVLPRAWSALRRLRPDMNLLMCVAVGGAIAIDEWLEAAAVTFLFSLALVLEQWSVGRARRAVAALMDLTPATARCRRGDDVVEVPVDAVTVGEILIVRPGEQIPLDGVVHDGGSAVDQSPITGESMPVEKDAGDVVYAGSINGDRPLEVEATRLADDSTLARIIHLVQEAHSRRAPSEQWVERFARYYTPAMMALALVIAVVPPIAWGADWLASIYQGLVVLVIACPCALVISTPVSIVSALTTAARHGVLVKGGRFLEAVAHLRAIAIDKTGTLTHGAPSVQQVVPLQGHTGRELLQRAATLETHSTHPLAQAILRHADEEGVEYHTPTEYEILQGRGAQGTIDGRDYWIGSHRLMTERLPQAHAEHDQGVALEEAGQSVIAVGNASHVCGLISIADSVREEARDVVQQLRAAGIRHVAILTGDNNRTARAIAEAVGVTDFVSESLPADKVASVERLRDEHGSVAMMGDGVNDSPALAAADVGIAMGAIGSDAAIETADVALISDDLTKVPWLISLARRTLRTIKQNIAVALGLKLVFLTLSLFGLATLWSAIAADMGASLLVVFNGMRLLR